MIRSLIPLMFLVSVVCAPLAAGEDLVPLALELPKPVFIGTPKAAPSGVRLDKNRKGPRKPYMVEKGLSNLAFEKPVTASDKEPIIGEIKQITDGDKEGASGSYVEFGPGLQWAQVDLGAAQEIHVIMFWFYHGDPRIYQDVIVQVAEDADFITGVKTIFNNDFDNSAGMGVGNDFEFFEVNEGQLVDAKKANDGKPVKARYVRIFSKGSTADEMNRFTEIEVWGRKPK